MGIGGGYLVARLFLLDVSRRCLRHFGDIRCDDGGINALALSPGGNRLLVASSWAASASGYDQLHLFDTRNGRILWKWDNAKVAPEGYIEETGDETNSAAFASNGRLIAVDGPEYVEIRRARDGKLLSRKHLSEAQSETSDQTLQRERRFRAELAVR